MAVQPLSAKQLYDWIEGKEDVVLLDVRSEQEFAEWRIRTDRVPSLNIPLAAFEDEEREAWRSVPQGSRIAVICRRGRTAMIVSEILDRHGLDVYCLNQGMQEWSQFYNGVKVVDTPELTLVQFNRLGKGCLSYMVISGGEAMVVDAGRHTDVYGNWAEGAGAKICYVMDTHLHADHISGGRKLADQTGAAYCISSQEMSGAVIPYEAVESKGTIRLGAVEVEVVTMETPGHTLGSVCYLVDGRYLLSGDTIFVGGLGRPDLGGKAREWAQLLHGTVFKSIAGLSDEILILPAHYSEQEEINAHGYVGEKLGSIRRNNEIMRTEDLESFTEQVVGAIGATPPNYASIVQVNRGLLQPDPDQQLEFEVGPNRCAVKHRNG